jgi:DNA-binding beta-propeller fold protein YncE
MAVDQKSGRLFVGCANRRMVVLDSNSGRVIGSVPIGAGPDDSAYDPATGLVYISNGDGTVSIIRQDTTDSYSLVETVHTAPGARNMALDTKTKRLFLPLSDREPPPPATAQNPNPRARLIPGTFRVLVFGM